MKTIKELQSENSAAKLSAVLFIFAALGVFLLFGYFS
jgi:hypothetical protein